MTVAMRTIARHCLRMVDAVYRRWHRLQPVGPLLFVGRTRYRGPARRFADGTELRPGDALGTLHFDNARISALDAATPGAIGIAFTRLLFDSLRGLAKRSRTDPRIRDILVFQGIGWIRHGRQVGFVIEPFPEGARKRFLALHIGLLVRVFAPSTGTAIAANPEPTITWLTRTALLKRFEPGEEDARTLRDAAAEARHG